MVNQINADSGIRRRSQTFRDLVLVSVIDWHISAKFTDKVTGKVTNFGPGIGVGAIESEKLTDELIVPMGGLQVAIRLPEELQSADRLKFDFVDGSFVVADH